MWRVGVGVNVLGLFSIFSVILFSYSILYIFYIPYSISSSHIQPTNTSSSPSPSHQPTPNPNQPSISLTNHQNPTSTSLQPRCPGLLFTRSYFSKHQGRWYCWVQLWFTVWEEDKIIDWCGGYGVGEGREVVCCLRVFWKGKRCC